MRWLRKGSLKYSREQRGFTLIETVVALGILGFIGVAFLSGLWTTSNSTDVYSEQVTASNLAQSAVEEIKASGYMNSTSDPQVYDAVVAVVTTPLGYHISTFTVEKAVAPDTPKQEVTVTVSRGGQGLFKLTTIKSDW